MGKRDKRHGMLSVSTPPISPALLLLGRGKLSVAQTHSADVEQKAETFLFSNCR